MAISTYDELMTSVAHWKHKTSTAFTARVPEFIALFEAAANATLRLRANEIEATLAATPASAFIDLPQDFQEPVSLVLAAPRRRLAYRLPDRLPYQQVPGPSQRWTIKDSRIQTERDADQAYAYRLRYHRRFALSADQPTNALLARYPNVYLYGALLEASPFVRDLDILALWQFRYDRATDALAQAEAAYKKRATLAVDPALAGGDAFGAAEG